MGSSMSDPAAFKLKNRQKHFLAYQRKHPDGVALPQKITLKEVKSERVILKKQINCRKNNMKRQKKNVLTERNFDDFQNKNNENQQEKIKKETIEKIRVSFSQFPIQNSQKINKNQSNLNFTKENDQINKKISSNIESSKSVIKKITLNNQTYQINVEKMKNRRLKIKQRYTNSILSSVKTSTMNNQSQVLTHLNGKSFVEKISSLQLQSELKSLKTKKSQHNSNQKQTDSLYDSDKLKDISNFSDTKTKEIKPSRISYKEKPTLEQVSSLCIQRKQ